MMYAKCIEKNDLNNIQKDICLNEFFKLRNCFVNALAKAKLK